MVQCYRRENGEYNQELYQIYRSSDIIRTTGMTLTMNE
jgi:hypothetical protein